MSITVIGGVIVSTFFTLLVVPCAYSLLARIEGRSHPEQELYGVPQPPSTLTYVPRPSPAAKA